MPGDDEAVRLRRLAAEVEAEVREIGRVVEEAAALGRPLTSSLERRAAGSLLHDFYTGAERLFRRVAPTLNGGLPEGSEWHRRLLENMAMPIEGVRPAVIGEATARLLDEYLRFRHLFRSMYGFSLDGRRIEDLLDHLPAAWVALRADAAAFVRFLRAAGS